MGSSLVSRELPAHIASNAENVSIWWRRHEMGGTTAHASSLQKKPKPHFDKGSGIRNILFLKGNDDNIDNHQTPKMTS